MSIDASITGQIEVFVQSAKRIEGELVLERQKNQKLAQEYVEVRGKLEKAVRSLQAHLQQRDQMIQQLSSSVQDHRNSHVKVTQRAREIEAAAQQTREELNQYKAAWAEVLARESEARNVLAEGDTLRKQALENRNENERLKNIASDAQRKLEAAARHVETYQRELQGTLIRLQSSEARFNQLNREYQLIATQKKSADEEISRLEANMRERFKWELATEREKIKAEVEKEAALDRERFRELTRRTAIADLEKAVKQERLRQRELESENADLKERNEALRQQLTGTQQNLEAINIRNREEAELKANQIAQALDRAERAEKINIRNQDSLAEMRARIEEQDRSLSLQRLEIQKNLTQAEENRKNLTKTVLIDKLRYEAEIERLKARIESISRLSAERTDLIIEKIDGDFHGQALMAYPVHDTRSVPATPANEYA